MHWKVADLAAFALDHQRRHPAPQLIVAKGELAEFGSPQRVEEQRGEDGPVPFALERAGIGRVQEPPRLRVGQGRRLAFVGSFARTFHAVDRIAFHGVLLAEEVEHLGHGGQFPPDARGLERAAFKVLAPRDDMRPRDRREALRIAQAHKAHEVRQVLTIGAAGVAVLDVGQPLEEIGHGVEPGELFGRELLFRGEDRQTARHGNLLGSRLSHESNGGTTGYGKIGYNGLKRGFTTGSSVDPAAWAKPVPKGFGSLLWSSAPAPSSRRRALPANWPKRFP